MRRALILLAPLVLLVAACGDDDDAGTTTTTVADGDDTAGDDAEVGVDDTLDDESDDSDPDADGEGEGEGDDADDEPVTTDTTIPTEDPAVDPPDEGAGEDEGLGDPLVFAADLQGDTEVPGPGDPAATGRAEIESGVDGAWCFDMVATGLDSDVTDSHIHAGAAGESGPVVVGIGPPTESEGDTDRWVDVCIVVADDVQEQITSNPEAFYVNVHSATFGSGAIRGQLQTATIFDLTLS